MSEFRGPSVPQAVFGRWLFLCSVVLVASAVVFLIHFQEYLAWDHPALRIDGEFIMSTHDAYHWLAGAKSFGKSEGSPMALLHKWLAVLTGLPVGLIGFWTPVVAASLVAAVMVLWAWLLGAVEAGLLAGVLVGLAPGFFYRTRFGCCDTDIVSLLFPLTVSLVMACWLAPRLVVDLRGLRWRLAEWRNSRKAMKTLCVSVTVRDLILLVGLGLFARWCSTWHRDILIFNWVLFCLAVVLALLLGREEVRWGMLLELIGFGFTAFFGWIGLGLAIALLLAVVSRRIWLGQVLVGPWSVLIAVLMVCVLAGVRDKLFDRVFFFISGYLKPIAQRAAIGMSFNANSSLVYPGIAQSIIEAQNIKFSTFLAYLHPWGWVGLFGLIGYVWVCCVRPVALVLLPLLLLGVCSVKLGARMAMFGAPPALVGFSLLLVWHGRQLAGRLCRVKQTAWIRVTCYTLLLTFFILIVFPYLQRYPYEQATPVLHKAHCMALQALGRISPPNALVWTWWDWGYATHYYARRSSFADGGKHSGEHMYILGRVLTTSSPRQANQLMRYTLANSEQPWKLLNRQSAEQVQYFIDSLEQQDYGFPSPFKQYLVVTIENLRLGGWITFYGTWNLLSRRGQHAKFLVIDEPFEVDCQRGCVIFKSQPSANLSLGTLDVLGPNKAQSYRFSSKGTHLLIVRGTKDFLILDDLAYESLMVQLLIVRPDDPRFTPYFRLVYQDLPWIRIFELC